MKVKVAIVRCAGGRAVQLRVYDRNGRKVCVEMSMADLGALVSGIQVSAEAEWAMPDGGVS